VLIQFGHNDASYSRPERYAPAAGAYRDNLLRMIWESRGRGLTPVLVTPPARRSFEDGRAKADFADYSQVMRELVVSTNTPLIDLEARSLAFVTHAGEAGSRKYYLHYTPAAHLAAFPNGIDDDTHFSELGARAMANLVAQELKGLKVPVAEKVLAERPDLTRTKPVGSFACH
jgi:lysophospholipase L1-like esterase